MNENIKLPEGWKRVKLGEVAERITNGFVYGFSDIKKDGIPITRIETISEGYIDKNKLGYISEELYPYIKKYHLKTGDILFSHINSLEHVGKTAIYNNFPPFLVHGMNLLLLRFKNSMCYPFFLIYLLKKENIRNEIKNLSGQAVNQVSIKPFELSNLNIPLPPLPEQHKIAEILEIVDNAIEKTDRIIEKYKRIKQGLMQDLLTKGVVSEGEGESEKWRLRNEKIDKFKDSPLGRIPEEWEVVRLGEVGEIVYGERLSDSDYIEYGNTLVYGTTGIIAKTEKYLGVGETIILPRKGSINNKFYVEKEQKFFVIDTAFYLKFNSKEILNVKYIYNFIQQINLEFFNEATGVPSLNRGTLKKILIPLPPLPEQQRIATVLSQIDQTIEKEQAYKEKLERLKKGLMEDLLTGKVRVNNLIEEEIKDEIG
jgi:type I restriction enzyme S subunit